MKRTIVQTRKFSEALDKLISENRLNKTDYEGFERSLLENSLQGDVIQGTGGIRKTRLRAANKGKRGGFRVCYLDNPESEHLFLLLIYSKNEKENLNQEELTFLKRLLEAIKRG